MSAARLSLVLLVACGGGAPRPEPEDPLAFEDERRADEAPQASETVARGEALLADGDFEEAEAAFREAIEADASDVRAHLDLGLALEMQERWEDAERAYRGAIAADASFAEAWNNLGALLRDREATEEAVRAFREAVRLRPGFASAHLNLGMALEETGDPAGAMAEYRRVIELSPREPTSRIQLGLLQLAAGERDQALITLRRATSAAAGDRAMLAALGNGLRRAGDPEMAVRVLNDAVEAGEGEPPPALRAELALAQYAADHRAEAERTLTALIAAHGDFAIAHYLLANMLAARDAFPEAARHYQAYLRLEPNGDQAAQARERLERVRPRR